MKKLLFLILLTMPPIFTYAQGFNYQWHATVGGANAFDAISCMAADASGNVYIAGTLKNAATGTLSIPYSGLGGNTADGFVAKLNASGSPVWIKTLPAVSAGSQLSVGDIKVNNAGQIFICGLVQGGNIDIDPGAAANVVSAPLGRMGILVSLSSNGDFLWGGSIGNITGFSKIILTPNGDIAFAGTYFNNAGNIDVNILPAVNNMPVSNSGLRNGPFIVQYTSAGSFVKYINEGVFAGDLYESGLTTDAFLTDFVMDSNGDFYFSGNKEVYSGNALASRRTFIQKVPANFVQSWPLNPKFPKTIQLGYSPVEISSGYNLFHCMAIDNNNNLYVAGSYTGSLDFDPGAGTSMQSGGFMTNKAGYVLKLNDTLGFIRFSKIALATAPVLGTESSEINDLMIDNENVYTSGTFNNTIDLNPDAAINNISSNGQYDMYFAKYDTAMVYIDHVHYGGSSVNSPSYEKSIGILKTNTAIFALSQIDNLIDDIDPGAGIQNVVPEGNVDGLLAKFGLNSPLPVTWKTFTANWQNDHTDLNWSTWSEQNCAFYEVEKSIDATSWIAIAQVKAKGNSAFENTYSASDKEVANGITYYRIKQTDRDGRYQYSATQTIYRENTLTFSLYPNPCTMTLHIQLPESSQTSLIEIYSIDGKKLISTETNETAHQIDIRPLSKGTYWLRVYNNQKISTQKFIKQ